MMTTEKKKNLPLFYKNPQPITLEHHEQLSLDLKTNFNYAKHENSIPIMIYEYILACKSYPIVFVKGDVPGSLIVTGFHRQENVFINSKGEWMKDTYIPGYVSRYPFIFLEDQDQLILCLDVDSEVVTSQGENLLFENGKPTEFAENALKMCSDYQAYIQETRKFVDALIEHDLLIENQADFTNNKGETLRLTGFCIVDETKFKALKDDIILDWSKKGWLYFIYAHFISMSNWATIAQLSGSVSENAKPLTETLH